jgi:hypothetical protein
VFYFAEFIANALDCVIDPCAYIGMSTLVDGGMILSCSFEELLRVYFADVEDCVDGHRYLQSQPSKLTSLWGHIQYSRRVSMITGCQLAKQWRRLRPYVHCCCLNIVSVVQRSSRGFTYLRSLIYILYCMYLCKYFITSWH